MTQSSDIPEETWTPELLRARYTHPNELRTEAELREQAGDNYSIRFAGALRAEADRWQWELRQLVAGGVELDTRPSRKLTSREVAKILGGNIATMVECSDVATVRDALAWLYNSEPYWKSIEQL